jgi:hypothetical protein
VSNEAVEPDQPAWVISWGQGEDGRAMFRDGGEPQVALAVTRDELRLLESGLRLLPGNEASAALLDRLAVLHMDLDDLAD